MNTPDWNVIRQQFPTLAKWTYLEQGALLVVDGVQGAGLLNTPLRDLNADVVSIGGHKHLFGLNGSGILYMRPELIQKAKGLGVERQGGRVASVQG